MNQSNAWTILPEVLLPPRFVDGAFGSAQLGGILDAQRAAENVAFCRTMVAVYALFRDRYGERESAFLSSEIDSGTLFYAQRRELSLAYESVKAELSVALRIGPMATETVIDQAVGFIERMPRIFALIGANVISPRSGQEALSRGRVLATAQALEYDEVLAEFLERDALQVTALPALREAADRIVHEIDPAAAERRRKQAEEDRRFTIRPADDGMAAAFALLTAHEGREVSVLVDEVAQSVCEADPRTVAQRQADAWVMRLRGFVTLGCRCENAQCPLRVPRHFADGGEEADGARVIVKYRTLIQVVINERTLSDPDNAEAAYLVGHGPITAQHARDLAAREDAVIRPFGHEFEQETYPDVPANATPAEAAPADAADVPSAEIVDAQGDPEASSSDGAGAGGADSGAADAEPEAMAPFGLGSGASWAFVDVVRTPWTVRLAARCRRAAAAGDPAPKPASAEPERLAPAPPAPAPPGPASPAPAPAPPTSASPAPAPASPAPAPAPAPPASAPRASAPPAPAPPASAPPAPAPVTPRALVIAAGSSGYRFSADLTRYFTLLFPRCVFPLCTRPASRCQWDHKREFDHHEPARGGLSTADNGQPLCIPHHALKTAGLWTDATLPDGRILWIGPAGQRVIVDPSATVLALFPDLTRIQWTTPRRPEADGKKPKKLSGPTKLQREHARRQRLRQAHLDAVQVERDALTTSAVEHRLAAVLAGGDPGRIGPPPGAPPPY
ncbi:HNH endonuclease signature motif containing protein [Tsukamurella sp. PLM1]|uniref:HNH endonuclease signature motif containing protein n=1 Tax=Tsukamurella sp. PLM1 TaxID=2929795 RepID=UPI002062AB93|nr:HNH endonuclease signature motif containing protein [Tsukamurella sp. PLM1]BDH56408.1 hypothetical protein MTP03_13470 [Tsukamurella sp. PLM1]